MNGFAGIVYVGGSVKVIGANHPVSGFGPSLDDRFADFILPFNTGYRIRIKTRAHVKLVDYP